METAKASDVFQNVNNFFVKQNFDWKKKIGSICTNGAPAILKNKSQFAALVKKKAPNVTVTHCMLHRHAFAAKRLPLTLKEILLYCVKMINFIRSRFINHRLFKAVCRELGSDHEVLLYHSEVHWLSSNKILKQLQELKQEVSLFLKNKNSPLAEKIESESFLYSLSYLADIFGHINNVNHAMQGPGVTIMDTAEKLNAFLLKLSLWKCRLKVGNYANFRLLEDLILKDETRKESDIFISMRKEFCSHLDTLQTSFESYFNLGSLKDEAWIRNPFLIELNGIDDKDPNKDDLIDLRASKLLQIEYNATCLENFWCSQKHSYQSLAK